MNYYNTKTARSKNKIKALYDYYRNNHATPNPTDNIDTSVDNLFTADSDDAAVKENQVTTYETQVVDVTANRNEVNGDAEYQSVDDATGVIQELNVTNNENQVVEHAINKNQYVDDRTNEKQWNDDTNNGNQ